MPWQLSLDVAIQIFRGEDKFSNIHQNQEGLIFLTTERRSSKASCQEDSPEWTEEESAAFTATLLGKLARFKLDPVGPQKQHHCQALWNICDPPRAKYTLDSG